MAATRKTTKKPKGNNIQNSQDADKLKIMKEVVANGNKKEHEKQKKLYSEMKKMICTKER